MKLDIDIDDSVFSQIEHDIKALAKRELNVGIQGENAEEIAEYALHNEFGTRSKKTGKKIIPARPFFSRALYNNEAEVFDRLERGFWSVMHGYVTPEQVYNKVGQFLQGKIRESITKGNWKSNKLATRKKKGMNKKVLVDSGDLIKSIDYEVK